LGDYLRKKVSLNEETSLNNDDKQLLIDINNNKLRSKSLQDANITTNDQQQKVELRKKPNNNTTSTTTTTTTTIPNSISSHVFKTVCFKDLDSAATVTTSTEEEEDEEKTKTHSINQRLHHNLNDTMKVWSKIIPPKYISQFKPTLSIHRRTYCSPTISSSDNINKLLIQSSSTDSFLTPLSV
jgi:hypothetical protein